MKLLNFENMFWGVTVDAGKRYSQTVEEGFRLSMAALENKPECADEYVQVMLQQETSEFLLCTLQHGKLLQQPVELMFAAGETVSFSLNGSGTVHLTGYLVTDDLEGMEHDPDWDETTYDQEGEEEESDDEIPDLIPSGKGKRKAEPIMEMSKKLKLLNDDGDEDSDDEVEDEEDSDDEVGDDDEEEEDFSDDFDDDSFLDEEASEDENEMDDEEDEMETSAPQTPQSVKQKKQNEKKTPKQNENIPKPKQKTPKQNEQTPKQNQKTPKQNGKTLKENGETPKAVETPNSQKKSKKAQTPKAEVATPKSDVSDNQSTPSADGDKKKKKKKKKKKNDSDAADSSMNESKTDTPKSATKSTPKKRVVAGGTVVEDLKDGHGPEAKPGKMVGVFYKGVLQKNNKQFDSCLTGKPFRFRLNKGEVIKGWDTGVSGMKVGGKRKITVPASQGYGNRGNGPIPANSVLVFEVELKSVS